MTRGRRLYLFDIDGTLINTGGAGGLAMRQAFAALWGDDDGFRGIEFSGRTDRAILRDALTATGRGNGDFGHDLARFKRAYLRRLPATLRQCDGRVIAGVRAFLDILSDDAGAVVALATGNFRRGAHLKLSHYGVAGYFHGGGFGDRAELREDMVADALQDCRGLGPFDTVFVIGDTVHDVTSAKAHGAIAVAVTTGAATAAELSAAGADVVLPSLEGASRYLGTG